MGVVNDSQPPSLPRSQPATSFGAGSGLAPEPGLISREAAHAVGPGEQPSRRVSDEMHALLRAEPGQAAGLPLASSHQESAETPGAIYLDT